MIQNKNIVIAALTIALAATVSLPALAQQPAQE